MSNIRTRVVTLGLGVMLGSMSFKAATEDIDIFSVDQNSTVGRPNVLIVLDNSSNWARQSQQWPGGLQQGQSEVRAITRVINELPNEAFNLGLLEFITGGSSSDTDSGFVRFHIRPMTTTNKANLSNILYGPSADGDPAATSIFSKINDPDEKRSQGNPFGNLFWDVYNYLAGTNHSNGGAGTLDALSDDEAYSTKHSVFNSPLGLTDACSRTIVIFIGNNVQAGPTGDSEANVSALTALGGDTDQIQFADYVVTTTSAQDHTSLGSSACFADASSCTSAVSTADTDGNGIDDCSDAGYTSCFCDADTAQACDPPSRFEVFGVSTVVVSGPSSVIGSSSEDTGQAQLCQNNDPGSLTCPTFAPLAGSTFADGPEPNQVTETNISWSSCFYQEQPNACGNNNNKSLWKPRGTKTTTTTIREKTSTALGPTTSCAVEESSCDTTTVSGCPGSSTVTYESCFCSGVADSTGCPPATTSRFTVVGNYTRTSATATGTFSTPPTQGGSNFMMDEWARFLRMIGVPIPGTAIDGADPVRAQVTTYTIDVFNAQQDPNFSALLFNAARVGGGKYYQAKNEDSIVRALSEIFAEVQAVNTAFASASLPVSATNQAQNENQVFVGLFRPDRTARPQWFGNLKRFEVVADQGGVRLGDKNGNAAVNSQTGFLAECSASFWTVDSSTSGKNGQPYWQTVATDDPDAKGLCTSAGTSPWSDLPDGPFVEKGAVAEVLRRGNDRAAVPDADGNFEVDRDILTLSGTTLVDYTADCSADDDGNAATSAADSERVKCFMRGEDRSGDQPDADNDGNLTEPRSTIHGDVVHSRPQPVNFGGDTGVIVYYGANDGTLRAVRSGTDADGGTELWSFLAPEHAGKFARLRNNTPNILYFGGDPSASDPKDYFFDGSIGLLQRTNNSEVSIFPSMRRGGRRVYKFEVTGAKDDPDADPIFRWRKGCDSEDDASCDTDTDPDNAGGFTDIGQTWSQPSPAFLASYSSSPVVVFGGGYDSCEDANTIAPSCNGAKGSGVYVLDSGTGAIIRYFDFEGRSVAADVAMIDVTGDNKVDLGYAVTTGGDVWRIDFRPGDPADWTKTRIAYTSGMGHKFLFRPALLETRQNGLPVIYLAIGSGDREHPLRGHYPFPDPDSARVGVKNRFYVFKDEPDRVDDPDDPDGTLGTLDLNGSEMADNTNPLGATGECEAEEVLPTSSKRGWFIDLDERGNGEQVVTSAVIAAGEVFFSTNRADDVAPAGDELACTNSLGEARGYAVDLFTGQGVLGGTGCGTRSAEFTGGGLPPSPVIATIPVTGGSVETICLGCITSPGGNGGNGGGEPPVCVPGSPVEACLVNIDFPAVRRPLYWYTVGDTE